MADQLLNRRRLRLNYRAPTDTARRDTMKDADRRLVQRIAQVLEFHHPGHFFQVEVDHAQRLVKMNLPPLMESPVWYTIPISVISSDPGLRCVIRAAGEILERYQMPRSRWDTDQYRAAVRAQPFAANRKKSYQVPA